MPDALSSVFNRSSILVRCQRVIKKKETKCIWERKINKVTAKNCRQRKLEVIFDLQCEIKLLKEAKSKIAIKSRNLQEEIAMLRQSWALVGARSSW